MTPLRRLFGRFRAARRSSDDERGEQAQGKFEWAVVGLGNPDAQYLRSRHNAGFLTLDRIAAEHRTEFDQRRFNGVIARTVIAGARSLLVKPETYYNLSGECVSSILAYYKIPPENLIVVHDELDLEAKRLRLKRGGGNAGNRGVRSVEESLGSAEFIRVRIGVGRPAAPESIENKDFLLRPMTPEELADFAETLERAAAAVEVVIGEGLDLAMGRFNQRVA